MQSPETATEAGPFDNIIFTSLYDAQSYQKRARVCMIFCFLPGPPYLLFLDKRTRRPTSADSSVICRGKRRLDVDPRHLGLSVEPRKLEPIPRSRRKSLILDS